MAQTEARTEAAQPAAEAEVLEAGEFAQLLRKEFRPRDTET